MAETKTRAARASKVYQLVSVVGPSAGVDLRTSPTLLKPERAQKLVNFTLTEPGALVVRPGYRAFSTSSLGSSRMQGAARVYLNTAVPSAASTTFTLVAFNGSVRTASDSGGWGAVGLSGLSTNEIAFPADRDVVAAFDGASSAIYKSTNGSSWTRFGIAAPSAIGSISSATTGAMSSGEYAFAFTYKDRDQAYESNGTTESTVTLTNSSGAFSVVVPNSSDPQVDAVVLYARKVSAGETVLRKVSSQAQSGGANSTFAVNSTSWTTADEIQTTHTLPPVLSFGVIWKNRWWARSASVTNRIHFTELFQPQAWPGNYYVDIPFERGDSIQAIVPLGDTLLIFGATKIFIILGQSSLDFEVRPTLSSEDGAFGPRAVCAIENGVVHVGANGVYLFDGTTDRLLSFDIEPAWRDLVSNATASDLSRVSVVYHQRQKELRIAVPRRYPSGTRGEWVLDLNRTRTTSAPAWTATDRDIVGYVSWDGPEGSGGDRGRLFSWPGSVARLYEEATGTSANSSNMTAEYEGPGLTMGAYRARFIDMRGEYEPHAGSLSVEPTVDGQSMGVQSVAMSVPGAVYGTAEYGLADYGSGLSRKQFFKMLPTRADGRTFTLKLNYSGQDSFRFYSYHVGIVPETAPRAFTE